MKNSLWLLGISLMQHYVIVRFGVSLKWVLYSRTIWIIEPQWILFCFFMNFGVKWCITVRAKLQFMAILCSWFVTAEWMFVYHTHTYTQTHAHTYARTHTRTHTCTHARTHTCTHARTHTHTHRVLSCMMKKQRKCIGNLQGLRYLQELMYHCIVKYFYVMVHTCTEER